MGPQWVIAAHNRGFGSQLSLRRVALPPGARWYHGRHIGTRLEGSWKKNQPADFRVTIEPPLMPGGHPCHEDQSSGLLGIEDGVGIGFDFISLPVEGNRPAGLNGDLKDHHTGGRRERTHLCSGLSGSEPPPETAALYGRRSEEEEQDVLIKKERHPAVPVAGGQDPSLRIIGTARAKVAEAAPQGLSSATMFTRLRIACLLLAFGA